MIKVIVNKNIRSAGQGSETKFLLKLHVQIVKTNHGKEIQKTLQNFLDLERLINEEFSKYSSHPELLAEVTFNLDRVLSNIRQMGELSSKLSVLQQYMNVLCSKLEYYTQNFLDFLEVPESEQPEIHEKRNKLTIIS